MQYDLNKVLINNKTIVLRWHGEATKVLLQGDSEKTEVNTEDTLKVSLKQAYELLNYSYLWTLKDDQPVVHQYNEMLKRLGDETASEEVSTQEIVGDANVDELDRDGVIAALKKINATFNPAQSTVNLLGLLKDLIKEKAAAPEVTDDANVSAPSGDDTAATASEVK